MKTPKRYLFCFTLHGNPWLEDTKYGNKWRGENRFGWDVGWDYIVDSPLQRFQVQYFDTEEELRTIKILFF